MKIAYRFADGTVINKIQISEGIIIEIMEENLETCLGVAISSLLGKEIVEVIHEDNGVKDEVIENGN